MKTNRLATTAAIAWMFFGAAFGSNGQIQSAQTQFDSVVAVVADAAGLPRVPVEELPWHGTFWEVRNTVPCVLAPLPGPPWDTSLPIYAIADGQFLIDETAGQMMVSQQKLSTTTYASLVQQQVDELANFIAWIQEKQAIKEANLAMSTMDADGPPLPGDGGGSGDGGGPQYSPLVYGPDDLWLEVNSVTNGVATFTIHTPDIAAYDLFGTTNLATDVPGLNGTNWVWLLRTQVGETNNIALTNLWPDIGFFRLGTMLDSDGDGLTDAYEKLVSHTNPNNWDTDGDGLSDGWEVEHGMNPNLDESAQTSGRRNFQYNAAGWLNVVSGTSTENITLDNEGNVQTAQ